MGQVDFSQQNAAFVLRGKALLVQNSRSLAERSGSFVVALLALLFAARPEQPTGSWAVRFDARDSAGSQLRMGAPSPYVDLHRCSFSELDHDFQLRHVCHQLGQYVRS